MVEELTVHSFEEFHSKVYSPDIYGTLYRGQKDIRWPLIPKIGRYLDRFVDRGGKASLLRAESEVMRIFRKQSAYHLGYMPADGWPSWSIAQHHGLPTRLMDWTHSPLVALFFAVEEPFDGDSVVYALKMPEGHIGIRGEARSHPLDIRRGLQMELLDMGLERKLADRMLLRAYEPSHETARVHAQSAMFTVQEDPTLPLDDHVQYLLQLLAVEDLPGATFVDPSCVEVRVFFSAGTARVPLPQR